LINGTQYKDEWYINSEPAQVPLVIKEIFNTLDGRAVITPEERRDIRLIFNELLLNAVIHGNNSEIEKRVHIRLFVRDCSVCVSILDEGGGFNTAGVNQSANREDIVYKESGRGMTLAIGLADEIVYSAGGRQVTFVKRLACHG
jgi:serine/threonine-protein kinase RsbW